MPVSGGRLCFICTLAVGKPSLRPEAVAAHDAPADAVRAPEQPRGARRDRRRASASRTAVLDTRSPSSVTLGIASTLEAAARRRAACSSAKSPARRAPKRKSSPTSSQRAPSPRTSMRSMKSSAVICAKRVVEAADVHALDAVRREQLELLAQRREPRRRLVGREELARMRLEGHHARGQARARARRRVSRASIAWWPTCTPSKLPMVSAMGASRSGRHAAQDTHTNAREAPVKA